MALLVLCAMQSRGQVVLERIKSFGFPELSGSDPRGAPIEGSDGALYGTTFYGGGPGMGVVYKLSKDGSGYKILHSFSNQSADGQYPAAGLIEASDHALYGTTQGGGAAGVGTVFRLERDGSGYVELHSFSAMDGDGQAPIAELVEARDGVLYGTTPSGGSKGGGVVFKLNKDGTGHTVLHSFGTMPDDGTEPAAALVDASDGALYGTTRGGGAEGGGTVFRLTKDGTQYAVLHSLGGGFVDSADGRIPVGLIEGSDGILYGTTYAGGISDAGTIFKVNKDGSEYLRMRSFRAIDGDGASPWAPLVEGKDGALYGTTYRGGQASIGTMFKLNKDGSGYVVLHAVGVSTLVPASNGAFYSAAGDAIYKISEDGRDFEVVFAFDITGGDGIIPGAIIEGNEGVLYGATQGVEAKDRARFSR